MKLYGVSLSELRTIVDKVSYEHYRGNLIIKDASEHGVVKKHVVFTLRVKDSREAGARRSGRGNRTVAACWHAHKAVMDAIFDQFPEARLTSAYADYRGAVSFRVDHPATASHNVGSMMNPITIAECCDC